MAEKGLDCVSSNHHDVYAAFKESLQKWIVGPQEFTNEEAQKALDERCRKDRRPLINLEQEDPKILTELLKEECDKLLVEGEDYPAWHIKNWTGEELEVERRVSNSLSAKQTEVEDLLRAFFGSPRLPFGDRIKVNYRVVDLLHIGFVWRCKEHKLYLVGQIVLRGFICS